MKPTSKIFEDYFTSEKMETFLEPKANKALMKEMDNDKIEFDEL